MKTPSFPFSPRKDRCDNDQAPMTYARAHPKKLLKAPENPPAQLWLAKKMVEDGCTLGQTLHVMQERCKSCNVLSPMTCVERCETWQVKKELRRTNQVLAKRDHKLTVLNALKNERRLALLQALRKQAFTLEELQCELKESGYKHSQNTIEEYLKTLRTAGLIQVKRKRFTLTLYGKKVHDAVVRFDFRGHLPTHSEGYEERVLRTLLQGAKTRDELSDVVPEKSLSRTLRRLLNRKLILNRSPAARVFYFRTKRALSLEQLSPTQKRICQAISKDGMSAQELADAVEISLRRLYKYLRSLRGKKLVFRRTRSRRFALSQRGRQLAEFVDTVESIK